MLVARIQSPAECRRPYSGRATRSLISKRVDVLAQEIDCPCSEIFPATLLFARCSNMVAMGAKPLLCKPFGHQTPVGFGLSERHGLLYNITIMRNNGMVETGMNSACETIMTLMNGCPSDLYMWILIQYSIIYEAISVHRPWPIMCGIVFGMLTFYMSKCDNYCI